MRRRQALATFGPASLQHQATALRGHACAEAVGLSAPAIVRLKSTFRHISSNFLLQTKVLRLSPNAVCVKETVVDKALLFGLSKPLLRPGTSKTIHRFRKMLVS